MRAMQLPEISLRSLLQQYNQVPCVVTGTSEPFKIVTEEHNVGSLR